MSLSQCVVQARFNSLNIRIKRSKSVSIRKRLFSFYLTEPMFALYWNHFKGMHTTVVLPLALQCYTASVVFDEKVPTRASIIEDTLKNRQTKVSAL